MHNVSPGVTIVASSGTSNTPKRSSTTRTTSRSTSLVFCPQYEYSTVSPTVATSTLGSFVNVNVIPGGGGINVDVVVEPATVEVVTEAAIDGNVVEVDVVEVDVVVDDVVVVEVDVVDEGVNTSIGCVVSGGCVVVVVVTGGCVVVVVTGGCVVVVVTAAASSPAAAAARRSILGGCTHCTTPTRSLAGACRCRPGDATESGPEHIFDNGARTSYSNIHAIPGGSQLYAFVRSIDRDPNFLVPMTMGRRGPLADGFSPARDRPYVRYASDGSGSIHLVATDGQPSGNERVTGIYYGVIGHGQLYRSAGTVADADIFDDEAPSPERLTQVFPADRLLRPWTIDIELDAHGYPHVVFSVRVAGATPESDRRTYWYGRFDGSEWHVASDGPRGERPGSGTP